MLCLAPRKNSVALTSQMVGPYSDWLSGKVTENSSLGRSKKPGAWTRHPFFRDASGLLDELLLDALIQPWYKWYSCTV